MVSQNTLVQIGLSQNARMTKLTNIHIILTVHYEYMINTLILQLTLYQFPSFGKNIQKVNDFQTFILLYYKYKSNLGEYNKAMIYSYIQTTKSKLHVRKYLLKIYLCLT